MVTIKDVARRAAVSPSTVSRVIAGSNRISLQTKLRVQQAMEELNYVPNAIARSLARSHTRTIGFTVARQADEAFANPFFSEVMRGMSTVAQARDYNILLSINPSAEEEREKCMRLIKERRVDGLIVSTSRMKDRLIDALAEEQIPFVLIGRSAEKPVLSVNNDNVQAARTATIHLFEQGYERVLFLGGDRRLVVTQDRLAGYKQACYEWQRAYDEAYALEAEFSIEGGYRELLEAKERGIAFDAVLAADDLLALGAFKYAETSHYRVPEQLGVVGFNDSPLLSFVSPPMTSVRILAYELGIEAMELLIDTLEKPAKAGMKKEILLPSELIVRASSVRSGGEKTAGR
jgi:DNA-binding LacI/PurR family transcriptional regulator